MVIFRDAMRHVAKQGRAGIRISREWGRGCGRAKQEGKTPGSRGNVMVRVQ